MFMRVSIMWSHPNVTASNERLRNADKRLRLDNTTVLPATSDYYNQRACFIPMTSYTN